MRYEDVGSDVYAIMDRVIEKDFPDLREAQICILFDTKKKKTGDMFVFGRIKSTNDELKAFAVNEHGQMYDYIMFLDKNIWLRISEEEQEAIIFHELCHCKFDPESNTNQYKIQPHEVETFYAEIERSRNNPRWKERVAAIAAHVYDPDNNQAPEE